MKSSITQSITHRKLLFYSAALGASTLVGCDNPGSESLSNKSTFAPLDYFLDYDALGLAQLIKKKDMSQLELAEVIIWRIETVNPMLNFMTTQAFDRARNKAGSFPLDTPFAGVPILMKDIIDVGGIHRTDGLRLNSNNIFAKNVAYVGGVEAAGLNIFGMTNVPEFAACVVTANDMFGVTHNPWNLAYSAFSSSGGSAAVVAGGVLPMAHGTDPGATSLRPRFRAILMCSLTSCCNPCEMGN